MRRGLRWLRLFLALGTAVFLVLVVVPWCAEATRLRLKAGVARRILAALGIVIDADLRHAVPGALIVANHISWVDIFVINAVLPAAFVSKAEVRQWPLIGWLAARSDTVFLRRGSHGHARIINQEIAGILEKGNHVAVFPEGTTTDGTHLLHFHAALLQPALAAGRPVLPLAISYWQANGRRSLAPAYVGDLSLAQCTRAVIAGKCLVARLNSCPPLGLAGEDRRQVAAAARDAIAVGTGITPPVVADAHGSGSG